MIFYFVHTTTRTQRNEKDICLMGIRKCINQIEIDKFNRAFEKETETENEKQRER